MPYELYMCDDDILHLVWIGNIDGDVIRAYKKDVEVYLANATPERQIYTLIDAARDGKFTAEARRYFAEMTKDPRLGRFAVINASRTSRVMATFLLKVSRRDEVMRFFDNEKTAVAWLKEEREKAEMK